MPSEMEGSMAQGIIGEARAAIDSLATTQVLAEFIAGTRYDDLPPQVIADAKLAILDWLGSALAGAREEPARMARAVVRGFGSSDEATVLPEGRASAAGAGPAEGGAPPTPGVDGRPKGAASPAARPARPA